MMRELSAGTGQLEHTLVGGVEPRTDPVSRDSLHRSVATEHVHGIERHGLRDGGVFEEDLDERGVGEASAELGPRGASGLEQAFGAAVEGFFAEQGADHGFGVDEGMASEVGVSLHGIIDTA
jgi:hypothetical protein